MLTTYICDACGVQYKAAAQPPEICKICADERQFVPQTGQKWTTLDELKLLGFENKFTEIEPGLWSIRTYPQIGIGQRAYLIKTPEGNVLWDCITYLDDETVNFINKVGGLSAIAISHPHYYSTIAEWSEAFDCPIYIHAADQEWVTRESSKYRFWQGGDYELLNDVSLIHLGGHFEGSSVLLWTKGSDEKGTLLVGDTIFIVPDPGWVSFIYSAPNRIPLPTSDVGNIKNILLNYEFHSVYGAFENEIRNKGKEAIMKSADRYISYLNGEIPSRK